MSSSGLAEQDGVIDFALQVRSDNVNMLYELRDAIVRLIRRKVVDARWEKIPVHFLHESCIRMHERKKIISTDEVKPTNRNIQLWQNQTPAS